MRLRNLIAAVPFIVSFTTVGLFWGWVYLEVKEAKNLLQKTSKEVQETSNAFHLHQALDWTQRKKEWEAELDAEGETE